MDSKALYTVLLVLIIGCSTGSKQSKIELLTEGIPDSTLIFMANLETSVSDSGYVVDNRLTFWVTTEEPTQYVLHTKFESRETYQSYFFWKEKGNIKVRAKNGTLIGAKSEGSVLQGHADAIADMKRNLKSQLDSIKALYRVTPDEQNDRLLELRSQGQVLETALAQIDVDFIRNNPNELYSSILLKSLVPFDISRELTEELYSLLGTEAKLSKHGIAVERFLNLRRNFQVGDTATDFKLPNLHGQTLALSDFRGKYVLLDFWGSNCGPCRIENPRLLRLYREYRQNLEIVGVSVDIKKETWAKTVETDSMIWTTVADLRGIDGDIPTIYGIDMIPTYYIIDPNGVIVAIIEGRMGLEEKLRAIMDR